MFTLVRCLEVHSLGQKGRQVDPGIVGGFSELRRQGFLLEASWWLGLAAQGIVEIDAWERVP